MGGSPGGVGGVGMRWKGVEGRGVRRRGAGVTVGGGGAAGLSLAPRRAVGRWSSMGGESW